MKNDKNTRVMLILWILAIASVAINIIIFTTHNSSMDSEETIETSNSIQK